MITAHHLRLIDGPLNSQSLRTALLQRMANELLQAGTAGSETAAMRTLRDAGHAMADIVMLVDEARQAAVEDVVAKEMARP